MKFNGTIIQDQVIIEARDNMNKTYRILYLENDTKLVNQARSKLEAQGYLVKLCSPPDGDQARQKLEEKGYLVDLCTHEGCFIDQIKHEFYDLLIIDYASSGKNGLEVLKNLRGLKDLPPAIMVSASKDIQVAVEAMKLGCSDYIIKEIGDYFDLLSVSIKNVLEKQGLKKAKERAETSLLVTRDNLQRAQKLAKIGSWEYYPGENVAYWSRQEFINFGYDWEMNGVGYDKYIDKVHPEDRKMVEGKNTLCLEMKQPVEFDFRLVLDSGEIRYIHSRTEVDLDPNRQVIRIFGISQDVTEQKFAERKLKEAAGVFETTTEAIFITDAKNKIISVNSAFTKITGFTGEEVTGKDPSILSSGRHDEEFFKEFWKSLDEKGSWEGEIWNRNRDDHVSPVWQSISSIKDEEGNNIQFVSIFSDITKRKQAEELIRYQANIDGLTELPNRNLFLDRLATSIRQAHRNKTRLALLLLDLDRFKWINDTLGHRAGDLLLQETAKRLQNSVRDSDTVARLGGDEFTIILPELEKSADAEIIAGKIFDSFKPPVMVEDNEVFISGSIGITVYPDDGLDVETLQKNADSAMYSAKDDGRNRFHYFTPKLQVEAERRLRLINLLRKALVNQEFSLHYQPIINIISDKVVCAEALLRWNHPEQGFIPPAEFIPLAEETGLIRQIGEWVFMEVISHIKRWKELGVFDFQISINKSASQFKVEKTDEDWLAILSEEGINPDRIIIEITESVFMVENQGALESLQLLQEQGIQISLDDFGTGFSSLSYLKRFPIDILKIDRSFIRDISDDPSDALLVETIITLADKFGIKVVAEGVETTEQLNFVRQRGCRCVQGYFFSKPLPINEFENFLKNFNGSMC